MHHSKIVFSDKLLPSSSYKDSYAVCKANILSICFHTNEGIFKEVIDLKNIDGISAKLGLLMTHGDGQMFRCNIFIFHSPSKEYIIEFHNYDFNNPNSYCTELINHLTNELNKLLDRLI